MDFKANRYDFSLLPSHVIAIILKNLNFQQRLDAGRTCKSWYFASCDPIISRGVCIRIWRKFKYPLDELNRPFGKLILQEINFNKFNFHEFLSKFGRHIREINFDFCHISMHQLLLSLTYLTNLNTFKIKPKSKTIACSIDLTVLPNADLVKTNLNRVRCFGVVLGAPDAGGLQFLMSMMPNLKTIYFSPEEFCGQYIFKTLFDYINLQEFLNLQELEIGDLFGTPSSEFFKDFSKIQRQLNIQKLTLGIVRTRYTNRSFNTNFNEFCKKLTNLRVLVMFSIGGSELVICRHMTKLTDVNLWDKGINDIRIIGRLRHLEKLQLNVDVFRDGSDEESLIEMFTQLENLTELRLNRYPVSRHVLNSICTNCTKMTKLQLTNLKTNKLQTIFKNLIKLKLLHITFPVDNANMFYVDCDITNLELLEELDISGFAPGMTMKLIQKLPNLKIASLEKIRRNKC